jgi:CspA family cold shock protein
VPQDFVEGTELAGNIVNLIAGKGYGFIKPTTGNDNYFFHASDLIGVPIDELRYDDPVRFVTARGEKGIVAKNVRLETDAERRAAEEEREHAQPPASSAPPSIPSAFLTFPQESIPYAGE